MLETVAQHLVPTFVLVAKRTLREVVIEVTETYTEQEIMAQIQGQLTEIPSQDLIKNSSEGQVSPECDLDLLWMKRKLESDYYFLKIKDQTKVAVRAEDYQYDRSLKGEFVRLVQETDLSEEDQSEILKLGIPGQLKGEVIVMQNQTDYRLRILENCMFWKLDFSEGVSDNHPAKMDWGEIYHGGT